MSQTRSLILTQYPIVNTLRKKVHEKIDREAEILIVSTIASSGYRSMIQKLRRTRYDKIYVLITEESVKPLASVLQIISCLIPARKRFLVSDKLETEPFTEWRFVREGLRIVGTVVLGCGVTLTNSVRAKSLSWKPRTRINTSYDEALKEGCAYFKTNLWLGVQAGGALTHTWGIVNAFLTRNIEVLYFATDARGYKEHSSFKHIRIRPELPYVVPREINHFIYDNTFVKVAAEKLSGFRGVIYQRLSLGSCAGVMMSQQTGAPLVLEYNGSESWLAKNWGTPFQFQKAVKWAEAVSIRHAHMIVTVSEPLRQELIDRGVDDWRIVVHPNGVDPENYNQSYFGEDAVRVMRASLGVPHDATIISFVGTFGPWHGAELLSASARQLIEDQQNSKLYFLFIGDGVRRKEVEDYAGDLVQKGRIILTGLVEPQQIPMYLAASDILAAPTVPNPDNTPFFGSPTKLFEYMAAGKPIVASQIGQITDIMEKSPHVRGFSADAFGDIDAVHDQFGVVVTPGSVDELRDGIRCIIDNPALAARWGALARECVLKKYTWQHHLSAILERLEIVIDRDHASKTRVLINGLHSKSGGGVTYLRNLLPILCADQRLDVHICLNEKQMPLFEPWLGEAKLHKVSLEDTLWRTILFEQFAIPKLARKINVDVTFSPANYGPIFAPNAVVLLRNALSVAFVERRLPKILYWAMLYLGTLLSVFAARNVISVSEYASKATVGNMFDWRSDKFHTIPHGISANFEADSSMQREENSLLFVSDIYVQKNLHGFFKSLAILKKQFPDIKLRVAGTPVDSDYDERIRMLMHELQLGDVVEFLGNLDTAQLTQEYRCTTVFVFPSTVETFGNPLVEAMACGAPIACSNTAAMPEVAGEAAEYFDPYNAEDMARTIEKLLNDKGRREELSRLGIERSKIYSWEETARKTADVLIDAARN